MKEVIRLWESVAPPTTIEDVPPETAYLVTDGAAAGATFYRNISDSTLTVFEPAAETANGVGVIVVPGGGWAINAWGHEGLDVATWLAALGYTAFVLKYRLQSTPVDPAEFAALQARTDGLLSRPIPHARKPTVIGELISTGSYLAARAACADDGRRAIEIVRAEAERFGLRREAIGMIGFSAGAFLIVDVALDPRAEPLAFIAPIYGGETCGAPVPADAPPLFTAVAQDDLLVRIVEGLHADWSAADRPSELHEFRRGGHGFGMVRQGLPSDAWNDLFLAWLSDLSSAT
jgi:acetyl esterase/lipase